MRKLTQSDLTASQSEQLARDLRGEQSAREAVAGPAHLRPPEDAPAVSPAELARRQALVAHAFGRELADPKIEAAARLATARAAAERAALAAAAERERERPQLTNPFDLGPPKKRWDKEGPGPVEVPGPARPRPRRYGRRKLRPWKERPAPGAAVLDFCRDHAWTKERSQALATRVKKNDSTIAHPRAAEATLRRLPPWDQAAIRRALRAQGWTIANECARRHVALWDTWHDFARPRAYLRARRAESSGGATRFRGLPRYGLGVVGWTQTALALALSGPSTTDGGADPIDTKTVQRHVALASVHGGVQVVVRNPDAEATLRGAPCASNPRGWPINAYWIPAPGFHKPAFVGAHFDENGNPLALETSLAITLMPRAKRRRRLRELRAQQAPPPTV